MTKGLRLQDAVALVASLGDMLTHAGLGELEDGAVTQGEVAAAVVEFAQAMRWVRPLALAGAGRRRAARIVKLERATAVQDAVAPGQAQ